jgi:hypothetical protein
MDVDPSIVVRSRQCTLAVEDDNVPTRVDETLRLQRLQCDGYAGSMSAEHRRTPQLLLTKSSWLANSSFATNGVANSLSAARDAARRFVQARCAYSFH